MTTTQMLIKPREKIATQSTYTLSDHELLQALIGSGNGTASVGSIARNVLKLLRKEQAQLNYAILHNIPGLGAAGVAKILAAFELASRYPSQITSLRQGANVVESLRMLKRTHEATLLYVTQDGAGRVINERHYNIDGYTAQGVITRTILQNMLKDNAAMLRVGITGEKRHQYMYLSDLSLCKALIALCEMLSVTLKQFTIVTDSDQKELL